MTQEKSPRGAGTPVGGGEDNASPHLDNTTPLRDIVMDLLEAQTEASKRIAALEREVKRLKRQAAESYDWSAEVPREMREVS